jgi:hypothetical protein
MAAAGMQNMASATHMMAASAKNAAYQVGNAMAGRLSAQSVAQWENSCDSER